MVKWLVRVTVSGAVAIAACLGLASTSHATGSCGSDLSQSTACPFATSPATLSGSLASTSETDYFVFWARRNTHLTVTVNDAENASCSLTSSIKCGGVLANLVDNHGDNPASTSISAPADGVAAPESFSRIVHGGIWYLEVSGQPDSTGAAVPYTLSIDSSTTPAVAWPPLCVVPKVRAGVRVRRARSRLRGTYCLAGKVHRHYNRHVRRGHVVRLHPGTGAVEPYHTRVAIVVSRGRRHRHHHHRHR